jgi:SAM-dependent methyltransferase
MDEKPQNNLETVASALAFGIRSVADKAANEEELRIGVEKLLEPALKKLGIAANPRYERRISRTILTAVGRADALYGQAIIEYEPPGKLSTSRGKNSTKKQIEGYLLGLAGSGKQREDTLRRVAGIAIDGQSIFFVRYRGDKPLPQETIPKEQLTQFPMFGEDVPKGSFVEIGPYQITEESVNEFLIYLRALRRRRLTADELGKEFGPEGGVAHQIVNALYTRLEECLTTPGNQFPRVETLYEEWKRIFGIVYGQELTKAQRDANALARLYHIEQFTDLKPLLFSVHTYYAMFMKLLAAELLSLQQGALLPSIAEQLPAADSEALKNSLHNLENNTWFKAQGIRNFLEADFFGWYLSCWNNEIEEAVRSIARSLAEYEPATGTLSPEDTRDLLKKLYQYLLPRELRHDLGEYYTPDWLAEVVLNDVGYNGNPEMRVLDPACGSGTFLVLAIRRIRDYAQASMTSRAKGERELLDHILENVVGFDLNPLAVISARTNYLLALGNLARHMSGKDIPVYICDSVLTPQSQRTLKRPLAHQKDIPVPSAQKEFWIPEEIVDNGELDELCRLLENSIEAKNYSTDDFISLCRAKMKWKDSLTEQSLVALYKKVQQLEKDGRNGLWARIIKNAFAPVFRANPPFDYVVGNPPWVRWGYLSDEYREATMKLWIDYGLFSLKGMAARLGGGEKDFSMLFLYASADYYLRDGGRLGFVITQEVFKAKGAGEGFRRFRLHEEGAYLRVLKAGDFVSVKPFENAANKTATIILEKGVETSYPVPYTLWQRNKGIGNIDTAKPLGDVLTMTTREELTAYPIENKTSAWQTTGKAEENALMKVKGESAYRAYRGASTDPYGVFWLKLKSVRSDGMLVMENLPELGKRDIKKVDNISLEPELVYPAVRGRDIKRWQANPGIYVLITQDPNTRKGYPESQMKNEWTETYGYLQQFEASLRDRAAFVKYYKPTDPFYSQFNVSTYTFSSYKVVWKRMANDMVATVISTFATPFGDKVGVGTDTTSLIPFENAPEAHYVCALLNSSLLGSYIRSFSSAGRGFGAPSIIKHIAIPVYTPSNPLHVSLSNLSQKAHQLASHGKDREMALRKVEKEIDQQSAQLWGVD